MNTLIDPQPRQQIDKLLGEDNPNPLKDFLYGAAESKLPSRPVESQYQLFVVETMPGGQREIHRVSNFGERQLAAQNVQRPTFRFRWKCEKLLKRAERIASLDSGSLDFEQQVTLLWSDVAALKEHLGASSEVNEIVSALLVTYSQFVKRVTPKTVVEALVVIFRMVATYIRLPETAIDTAFDALEDAGVDLNHPLAFGKGHA